MFEGPRLKIKRANQHISDLNEMLNTFVQTDFYSLTIEEQENSGGNYALQFKMTEKAPCELPLLIGDAIHNLRSALDIAYCEVVTGVGATPTDWTRFMFFDKRDELVDKLGKGILKGAPDIVDLLADVIKPYTAKDNPLSALHSLDIADKHLLLLPVFSVAAVRGDFTFAPEKFPDRLRVFTNFTMQVDEGGILNAVRMPGKFSGYGNVQAAIDISFGQGQALEGQPIIPTLHQLSQLVSGIIETFEKALLARK